MKTIFPQSFLWEHHEAMAVIIGDQIILSKEIQAEIHQSESES